MLDNGVDDGLLQVIYQQIIIIYNQTITKNNAMQESELYKENLILGNNGKNNSVREEKLNGNLCHHFHSMAYMFDTSLTLTTNIN
ncbi:hypothetical protein BLOT_009871 [Blomia tropicalis]|nr:hypothetical protein BLOT_009871 [Blomia tropicalis]